MSNQPESRSQLPLIASHLRDFAEYLPQGMREDFNATIDDLLAVSETDPDCWKRLFEYQMAVVPRFMSIYVRAKSK